MSQEEQHLLRLVATFQDHISKPVTCCPEDCPVVWGRGGHKVYASAGKYQGFAELLDVNAQLIMHISAGHFRIEFDRERHEFWIFDQSLNGTEVETTVSERNYVRRYKNGGFPVVGQMKIRLRNPQNSTMDIEVEVEILDNHKGQTQPSNGFAQGSENRSPWEMLLWYLNTGRAVHLTGLPGTGKSFLARKLLDADGPWHLQVNRALGHTLAVWVDGHNLDDQKLWSQLVEQVVDAAELALAGKGSSLSRARDHVRAQRDLLNTNWLGDRIGSTSAFLRDVFNPLIQQFHLWPIIVFDDFDRAYAQLLEAMFSQLLYLHRDLPIYFVMITHRRLQDLRSDDKHSSSVRDFNAIFAERALTLAPLSESAFEHYLTNLSSIPKLSSETITTLYVLSGGIPSLAQDILHRLGKRNLLHDSSKWYAALLEDGEHFTPLESFRQLWAILTSTERQCALAFSEKKTTRELTDCEQDLVRLGVLHADGEFLSPLLPINFLHLQQQEQEFSHERGLRIDVDGRRYYKDGKEIKITPSHERVLLYLYSRLGEVCSLKEIYLNCWIEGHSDNTEAWAGKAECETAQKAVIRLAALVGKEHIVNVPGRGYRLQLVLDTTRTGPEQR